MGDFNDDMFNRLDSRIYSLMSTNGFKQLVSMCQNLRLIGEL